MVVRSSAEYEAGHIPEVQHLPLDELDRRMDEVLNGPALIVCRGIQAFYAWQMFAKNRQERPSGMYGLCHGTVPMAAGPLWAGDTLVWP